MRFPVFIMFLMLCLALPGWGAGEASVFLVKATSSVPNDAERNYAQALARNMERWLTDLGVVHAVVDDERLESALPADVRVIILCYNPSPSDKALSMLGSFVKNGGKLIVFYGLDDRLASLMGVKMGKYKSQDATGHWAGFRFNSSAPPNLPTVVLQQSRNIRTVVPIEGKARVVASWEDRQGRLLDDPALVQSAHGFWMTHVLLDDIDVERKKQMLLGLIGSCDPSVWSNAATKQIDQCVKVGSWGTLEDVMTGLAAMAKRRGVDIQAELTKISGVYERVGSCCKAKEYPEAIEGSRILRTLIIRAYGMVQVNRAGEMRGVWDHTGTGLYPGEWGKTCAALKENGFTDIFCNLLWPAQAHYAADVVPRSKMFELYGDQAEQVLAAAHGRGLKVHAWKICWNLEGAGEEMLKRFKKAGRLQEVAGGQTINWLCPANTENLKYEKDAVRELLKKYAFDGIHLDYIRFRDSGVCYCATCKAKFEKSIEKEIGTWPAAVQNGPLRKEFFRWRCDQINRYVRDVAAMARELRPGIKVSASVYGKYPSCVDAVGQDWAAWIGDGSMDFVCPMDYTTDAAKFRDYVRSQVAMPGAKGKIFPGIGVTATESTLDQVQVMDQIQILRQAGAPGFVLFDLNKELELQYLPILRLGTTGE